MSVEMPKIDLRRMADSQLINENAVLASKLKNMTVERDDLNDYLHNARQAISAKSEDIVHDIENLKEKLGKAISTLTDIAACDDEGFTDFAQREQDKRWARLCLDELLKP